MRALWEMASYILSPLFALDHFSTRFTTSFDPRVFIMSDKAYYAQPQQQQQYYPPSGTGADFLT
jgi:hypothetical protein